MQKNVRVNTAVPGAFARLKFIVDVDGVQSNLIITVEKIR